MELLVFFALVWNTELESVAYRVEGLRRFNPPPLKFRRPSKIIPNSTRLWNLLKIAEYRVPTPQDAWKKGSKILKLPSVRNCFTLAMTNKLVVIINSLKVPKVKKILLYEMKFLVPNYSCLQNPWLGGYRPQIPVVSVLNWIGWTPPNPQPKFLRMPLPGVRGMSVSGSKVNAVVDRSNIFQLLNFHFSVLRQSVAIKQYMQWQYSRVSRLEYRLPLTTEYLPVAGGKLHVHVLFPRAGAVHSHHFKWVAS